MCAPPPSGLTMSPKLVLATSRGRSPFTALSSNRARRAAILHA
jgi:hypothetical protein